MLLWHFKQLLECIIVLARVRFQFHVYLCQQRSFHRAQTVLFVFIGKQVEIY